MNKEDVKKSILKVAGYPETGIIAELADAMAEEICDLKKETKKYDPVSETRIVKPQETR